MTLMEGVLALALLAILLIFVLGLFLRLLAGSEKSSDLTAGAMLAESLLQEQCASCDFVSTAQQRRLLYNRDGSQAEEFLYSVTCTQVSPGIYYVDVEVAWGGGRRQGQGQLKTRLGRLASP